MKSNAIGLSKASQCMGTCYINDAFIKRNSGQEEINGTIFLHQYFYLISCLTLLRSSLHNLTFWTMVLIEMWREEYGAYTMKQTIWLTFNKHLYFLISGKIGLAAINIRWTAAAGDWLFITGEKIRSRNRRWLYHPWSCSTIQCICGWSSLWSIFQLHLDASQKKIKVMEYSASLAASLDRQRFGSGSFFSLIVVGGEY